MNSSLKDVLDYYILDDLADSGSFERGFRYHKAGRVGEILEIDTGISAKVHGTETYRVKLWAEDGGLSYSCSCPIGEEDGFCKHCVALGLSWLESEDSESTGSKPSTKLNDVREYLESADKGFLVDLLMDQVEAHDGLRRRLLRRVAQNTGQRGC